LLEPRRVWSVKQETRTKRIFEKMLRLTILDSDGKTVSAKDVPTASELLSIAEQARAFIRECERLAQQHKSTNPASAARHIVPYST